MARADYSYLIQQFKDTGFIVIEDLNRGRMSVTNNIEEVVDEICTKENINPVEHLIIYKDSDGRWDGFEFATGQFVMLGADSRLKAIQSYFLRTTTPE